MLCFKKWLPIPSCKDFSPLCFSRNFVVLSFILLQTECLCPSACKLICWNPNFQYDGIRRQGLWRWLHRKYILIPYKKKHEGHDFSLSHLRIHYPFWANFSVWQNIRGDIHWFPHEYSADSTDLYLPRHQHLDQYWIRTIKTNRPLYSFIQ